MDRTPSEGLLAGDRRALGRAISAIEDARPEAAGILQDVAGKAGTAHIVGITGAPGSGKSTLTSALIGALRATGRTVAVVAVDPSSPLLGGAILGDRIRMVEHALDEGVFVRSVAARGHLGGLSRTTAQVVDLLDSVGFDVVLVETVGSGQSETEVMHLAHTVVVVTAPGLGDEVQAIKAGVLEIADVFVVNKADSPFAAKTTRTLHDALGDASDGWTQPIIETIALDGTGITELMQAIDAHAAHLGDDVRRAATADRALRQLAAAAADALEADLLASDSEGVADLALEVSSGRIPLDEAARRARHLLE
ncbi:MAG: methylmalonyl Co-A mutase-associated GTPase MeaB [Acidimicrobiia bacterium]|nr:MAG: methylmalonyl Co-A mutase-associated GTPase MeaB [Acidimicrobiia bacterium]